MLNSMLGALSHSVNRTQVCERCECQLCSICAKPANQWLSPTGQIIETVTTRTQPRFTFAYNPYDDDMSRMRKSAVLEPTLTHAWHEATAKCCRETKGLVVDIGGNFGWYTLYSLALGCEVVVFEPVPAYQEVMRLGLALNPGFAARTTLYGNVVYDTPGNYTLRVPHAKKGGRMRKLGMTGMEGSSGILKADWTAESYNHVAASVRVDEIINEHFRDTPVCMVKADVEGYEPQVLQTARRLITRRRVPALQLELTRTPRSRNQTCAAVKMLAHLADLGYDFRQVNNRIVDNPAPPVGSWSETDLLWNKLPKFPSDRVSEAASRLEAIKGVMRTPGFSARNSAMQHAYRKDFVSFSTNLVAFHQGFGPKSCGNPSGANALQKLTRGKRCPPWPSLTC